MNTLIHCNRISPSKELVLENRLQADLARKPKFQKPDRQAKWREEIQALGQKLEQD